MKIIDLHQDISSNCMLMTHKNFFEKNSLKEGWNQFGWTINNQSDLPRMIEGGISVVFGAMCLMPSEMLLPIDTKKLLIQYQLDFYKYLEKSSGGKIKIVKNSNEISKLQKGELGIMLHFEGFYFIEDEEGLTILDNYYEQGVRSIGLTWNIDNPICGGAGSSNGLTSLGRKFIKKMSEIGYILDFAHINEKSFDEIMEIIDFPPIVSHTQITKMNDIPRNLKDSQIKMIAGKGGVIGLMPHTKMLGSDSLDRYTDSVFHVIELVGIDHVAVGTDFDGTTCPELIKGFESSDKFGNLIDNLLKRGLNEMQIEKILYDNPLRIIKQRLG